MESLFQIVLAIDIHGLKSHKTPFAKNNYVCLFQYLGFYITTAHLYRPTSYPEMSADKAIIGFL